MCLPTTEGFRIEKPSEISITSRTTDGERDPTVGLVADPIRASTWLAPPSWMLVPPSIVDVPHPIETTPQLLPFDGLNWEDFERLCLRIIQKEADAIHVDLRAGIPATNPVTKMYGERGQAQSGIDVYVRDRLVLGEDPPMRRYTCLQSRRIKEVTKAGLRNAADDFREGRWADVSRKFIYATSASMRSTELIQEIEDTAVQFAKQSIEFTVWDKEEISNSLKDDPFLVDDFFGRRWAEIFCGEAASVLGERLDAQQVSQLRRQLAKYYSAVFGVADSGLLAFQQQGSRPLRLQDRFVTPDLASITPRAAARVRSTNVSGETDVNDQYRQEWSSDVDRWLAQSGDENLRNFRENPIEPRIPEQSQVLEVQPADRWLGGESLQVIVGDPGAGKSTLLRFLVLDLLSEQPAWRPVAERWGHCLPIWLPFHFFTQRVASNSGAPASVSETLKAWLDQHEASSMWPLVKAALNDERLLLVVDGLDEWVNDEAGRYAVASLETFAETHNTPMVVSTRPYGLARLRLGAEWSYKRIAPLNPDQQRELAHRFFSAVSDTKDHASSPEAIEGQVDRFLRQIHETTGLRTIGGTPLFFVLLVGLHLSSIGNLPAERFDVYEQAVQMLLADHPARRRVAAVVTTPRQSLSDRQLRSVLAKVAFVNQERGDVSTFSDVALRRDFIDALRDADHLAMDPTSAAETADQLLDIAEGELGLLVRQGPRELGFLHRILQEQLVAEHISDQLQPEEAIQLYTKHVGDPRWHETLLATMWRLSRPPELKGLIDVVRQKIDESPSGLRAREIFAEAIFGSYRLPASYVRQFIPSIVRAIETHPYGPHRARLLDSVISGLDNPTTNGTVLDCLERWTMLVRSPSDQLISELALLPSDEGLPKTVRTLLVMGLMNSNARVAYGSAVAIAERCSSISASNVEEREKLKHELLNLLSDPPSRLAQAASLLALTLEWGNDPLVIELLSDARAHKDGAVRLVALSVTLGVLDSAFYIRETQVPKACGHLSEVERDWLFGRLRDDVSREMHHGLLVAAISEAIRGQHSYRDALVELMRSDHELTYNLELIWRVGLNVASDDNRVVEIVCHQLTSDDRSQIIRLMLFGNILILASAYPPESPHFGRLGSAIEERLKNKRHIGEGRMLFGLAATDQGPLMKEALLRDLHQSSWPHWSARALALYFAADSDSRDALSAVLKGEPKRASMIANVAHLVLEPDELAPRLLSILEDLCSMHDPPDGRIDILGSAIVRACRQQNPVPGQEAEAVAERALELTSTSLSSDLFDVRFDLADFLHPSAISDAVLDELANAHDRPVEPFLRFYRDEPDQLDPFLEDASKILRSLPANLRARVCQSLASGAVEPSVALRLTRRWGDEVSEANRSIASLAHHRAAIRAKEQGVIDDKSWELALNDLGDAAGSYGWDSGSRRRGAWVGMCVLGDWSTVKNRLETNGDPNPVGVELTHIIDGPDRVLLQQLAKSWRDLRAEFGEDLLSRISSTRHTQSTGQVWDALALVASEDVTLEQELESAIAKNPGLLKFNGVLGWFVTRSVASADTLIDAIIDQVNDTEIRLDEPINVFLAESPWIESHRSKLIERLESTSATKGMNLDNPALGALAVQLPQHPKVLAAWVEIRKRIDQGHHSGSNVQIGAETYFAVVYAAVGHIQFMQQIERDLERLDELDVTDFDRIFTRHVVNRLRRDEYAAGLVRKAVMDPTTSDTEAAALVSLLADAIGLDNDFIDEVDRRIAGQRDNALSPVMRDPMTSSVVSVQTIFTRILDATWNANLG